MLPLAVAVTVIIALFEPEPLLTVNQLWLLVTFQLIFEEISKADELFSAGARFILVEETDKTGSVLFGYRLNFIINDGSLISDILNKPNVNRYAVDSEPERDFLLPVTRTVSFAEIMSLTVV